MITIERIKEALNHYGYVVISEPLVGQEAVFIATLSASLIKIEETLSFNAKRYGYRGKSKRALDALHSSLPEPCFGVIVQ